MSISTNFNNYDGLPVQFAGLFELAILFLMFHIFKHTSSESGESGKHIKVKKKVFMKRRKKVICLMVKYSIATEECICVFVAMPRNILVKFNIGEPEPLYL